MNSARKKAIWPTKIFVSEASRNEPLTKKIISRLPEAEIQYLRGDGDPITEQEIEGLSAQPGESEAELFSRGKRVLQLTQHKGSWLKNCPGTLHHVCCNLFIVNPGEGCPFDCTYCYLQSYLKRNPTLKLYTNTQSMLDELNKTISQNPNRLFRVCTGELIDSLVWDELSDQSLELVPFFAQFPNAVLELKTKDNFVGNLISLRDRHSGNTVVSWSLNARTICENEELGAASLDERIEAAVKVIEAEYRVGFHFDPIVHFEGWQDEYKNTIDLIFSKVDPSKIAWISLSTLRYRADLQQMMLERFRESKIPYGEQFFAKDKKIRYMQPLRLRMQRFLWEEIKSKNDKVPIYMCMESPAAWRNISGGPPAAGSELVEVFSRKGRLQVLSSSVGV
jgi:spore photoproduct lyase